MISRFARMRAGLLFAVALLTLNISIASAQEPAPVPPQVAIPRPTEQEIAAAQKALDQLVAASPDVKQLLAKYPDLVAVRPPRPNTAIVPGLARPFQAKHQSNLEVAKAGNIDVLFMGDSITDFWRNTEGPFAGKPVFDEHFGNMKVANFGIAGDTTQGVLYRLRNGEGQGYTPKAVMLMIGTNNISRSNTAAEIAEGIGAVVLELRKDFPDAKILLLAVFPRGRANDPVRTTIDEINQKIARLHDGDHVHYLDIGKVFLDANGEIPTAIMSDGLHPSAEGYKLWAQAVKEPLARLTAD